MELSKKKETELYGVVDEDDSFIVSTIIGVATDSALLGGLLGGSLLGGILGDSLDGDLLTNAGA
jgi:hypothetical protein